jgi:transcriptional regulator with XRE-family HTH domain
MGRKRIEIDIREVERLAGLGLTQEEIALSLGVSLATITRRSRDSDDFDEAIKRGSARALGEVANALFQRAIRGDISAAIWWEKTRAGRSEKNVNQNLNVDISNLSNEQLERVANGEDVLSVIRS